MRDAILKLIIALEDKASAGLRGIQSMLQGASSAAMGMGSAMLSIAAPLGAAAAGGIGLGIAMNASAEQTEAAFTTLLGSGDRAMGFLEELRAFSASTPFEFPELADSSKKLLAFGFAAEDIIPMMTNIGDAVGALGGGQAEIDRVTMALGQMQAKGKVSAEEMMQLAELGIPAWQMLADSMGLSVAEVMKLAEQGKIAGDQAIPALLAGMNATFGGAMQGQAVTFNGLMSTLKDNASLALMAFTGPTFERAKGGLQELGTLAASPAFQQMAAEWGIRFAAGLDVVIARGGQLISLWPSISTGAQELAGTITGPVRESLDWLSGTALPAVQPVLDWLSGTGLPAARAGLQDVADGINGALREGLDWLGATGLPALQPGLDWLTGTGLPKLQELLRPLSDALRPVVDGFREGGLQGALSALPGAAGPTLQALTDLRTELAAMALEGLGSLLTKAADLPQLSRGLSDLGLSEPQIAVVTGTLRQAGEILGELGGIVRDVGQWFSDELLPPVLEAGAGFGEMLLPHLEFVGTFVSDRLMPILRDIGGFLADNLPGAIRVVSPLLTGLVDMGLSLVELALMAIATTWDTWLRPAFESLGTWLGDITGGWDNLARGAEAVKGSMESIATLIREIAAGNIDWNRLFGDLKAMFPSIQIPGFAGGVTNFAGGLAIVGEEGPELVRLPGGSDVIPAGPTASMLSGGGGGGVVVVHLNIGGSVVQERDLVETIRERLIDITRANGSSGV